MNFTGGVYRAARGRQASGFRDLRLTSQIPQATKSHKTEARRHHTAVPLPAAAYVQLSDARCYGCVTGSLFSGHSSQRSIAGASPKSGHRTLGRVRPLGSEPKIVPRIDIHPCHWNLPAWVRKAGAWVPRAERSVRRAAIGPRRTCLWVPKARSSVPVHRPVTIEGPKMGYGGFGEPFVSRNQTSGGSAEGREGIPLGSEHLCVASNDMGTYRPNPSRWPRTPEVSLPRARRSLQSSCFEGSDPLAEGSWTGQRCVAG
jgi:hypothetical protein